MTTKTTPTTIIIDTREQLPLDIQAYPTLTATLSVGDYGIQGFSDWTNPRFIIERKTVSDLVGSLTAGHERFFKEVEKLRKFGYACILIEGREQEVESHEYRSQATPHSILAMLDAIQVRAGIHIAWSGNSKGAALSVERKVRQFIRGIEKDAIRVGYKRPAVKKEST